MGRLKACARWLGAILLAWGALPPLPLEMPPPMTDAQAAALRAVFASKRENALVVAAVAGAYAGEGLDLGRFGPACNIAHTGKLYDVLYHAMVNVGLMRNLRTVGDLVELIAKALK